MCRVYRKTKMCSKGKALLLQPLLFQLVRFSRVALGRGGRPWGEGGWPGSSPQCSPAQQHCLSQVQLLQHLRICPRQRAGAPGHLGQSGAAPVQIPGSSGGAGEKHKNMRVVSPWQFAENIFWEVKGLVVVSILLLTAMPWGNEEDRIARTEG